MYSLLALQFGGITSHELLTCDNASPCTHSEFFYITFGQISTTIEKLREGERERGREGEKENAYREENAYLCPQLLLAKSRNRLAFLELELAGFIFCGSKRTPGVNPGLSCSDAESRSLV